MAWLLAPCSYHTHARLLGFLWQDVGPLEDIAHAGAGPGSVVLVWFGAECPKTLTVEAEAGRRTFAAAHRGIRPPSRR